MPRKTLIFGNGLGMALNPESFTLQVAIEGVWSDGGILSDDQKSLISACRRGGALAFDRPPTSEGELGDLHRVLAACDVLRSIRIGGRPPLLSDEGKRFPEAIRRFLHRVSKYFVRLSSLEDPFIGDLCDFVMGNKPHVATLNYDNLLYEPFVARGVCRGGSGALVDGMVNGEFNEPILRHLGLRGLGYYLHLHGTPLFYTAANGKIKKLRLSEIDAFETHQGHIVLASIRDKPAVIRASGVLSAYWRFFEMALDDSDGVLLFGYSGEDAHLNDLIAVRSSRLSVSIVEWEDPDCSYEERLVFWKTSMNRSDLNLVRMPKILEFNDWEGVGR